MRSRLLGALPALALLWPAAARAQSGTYVATLGRDTVAVESYTWAPGSLTGTSVMRTPVTMVRTYEMTLGADGAPRSFHVSAARPGGPVVQEMSADYSRDDSVLIMVKRDSLTRRWAAVVTGRPVPFFEDIFAPWATAVRRATGDSTTFVAGRQPIRFGVARSAGVTRFTWPAWGTAVVQTDARGSVTGLDFTGTTSKYLVKQARGLDVQKLAADFAAREKAGSGLGTLSPRDTARAEIGGAHLLVDYSRPSARGRTVFGGIVPWGQVWRTGANAATQLVTDRDLEIGGASVPAGTYTLWTIPAPGGWKLVINKQHGQWGTDYDPAQDLARVDLSTAALPQPVEQFSFEIVPGADGGTLAFAWASTRAVVPFKVK